MSHHPTIIQGGMGLAVSSWTLASTVARLGQLGVVSGTALGLVLARRLQLGDPEGHLRRALASFPIPAMAARIWEQYFVPGGLAPDVPFKNIPLPNLQSNVALDELTVVGNFVEVFLAKRGHAGLVGVNYLEKIQLPTLPSLYGAMLAGVDYILMGAGIPRAIPGILDELAQGRPVQMHIDVQDALHGEEYLSHFNPRLLFDGPPPALKRPEFLGIIASATLALALAKKASGRVNGFVVEGPTAGGHNAPPRGALQLTPEGEPLYGVRDEPEMAKIRDLGLPFWLAGSYGRPGGLARARQLGAAGIQVGTAFAFCAESGLCAELKRQAIALSRAGVGRVFTDPRISPTGFPFKVAQMPGTLSEPALAQAREPICDLGVLRTLYRKPDGTIGYRCPAEPLEDYVRKGGSAESAQGRQCVCNGLTGTVGLGQRLAQGTELPLVTAGNDFADLARFAPPGADAYTAADVLRCLLADSD